jgi:hypothetical protein
MCFYIIIVSNTLWLLISREVFVTSETAAQVRTTLRLYLYGVALCVKYEDRRCKENCNITQSPDYLSYFRTLIILKIDAQY